MNFTSILLLILALIIIYLIYIYNKLIRLRNLTQEGWSGIDVQLKQRANLIPNLVETVKGYMTHEKELLEKIAALRAQSLSAPTVADRAQNENLLTNALRQLFAVAENYPELKASQNFLDLQQTLTNLENQIQLSRRYYNGTVRDLNITIQSFPSNLVARTFQFTPASFFEIEDAKERAVPNVKF